MNLDGALHFRFVPDPAAVYGQPRGYPACGALDGADLTSDPLIVTCRKCWRSGPYRKVQPEPPMTVAAAIQLRRPATAQHHPPVQRVASSDPSLGPCRSPFCSNAAGRRHAGWCSPCHRRWIDNGRPAGGAPPPRRSKISGRGTAAGRLEDYAWLREEQGLTRMEAAARLGVTKRTALRYDARLRAQAAASQDLTLAA